MLVLLNTDIVIACICCINANRLHKSTWDCMWFASTFQKESMGQLHIVVLRASQRDMAHGLPFGLLWDRILQPQKQQLHMHTVVV